MSVIFGIFYKNGKPVSGELEAMYAGMQHFPHERHGFEQHGCCGFGHMLTYNTPEAVAETMPKWLEEEQLLFAAEGRIDNRNELFALLAIPATERAAMPDGDLILAAYRRWGEACVDHLTGKWSLAAFHATENRLFLARDQWDYTNLAYYADDNVFAFSSSEKGLLTLPFFTKEIDELMVARLLIIWPGEPEHSFYKGIRYLLPSHQMRVTRDAAQLHRYWTYVGIPVNHSLSFEEHLERLQDALHQSVAARLRSYKPVAATLSGGMDSSTVCMLAAEQLAEEGKRLRTYTHVPQFAPSSTLRPTNFGDEQPFAEAIAAAAGNIDPLYLQSAGISPLEGIREAMRLCGRPSHGSINAYWIVDIYQTAIREGYGTLLMGEFGNATTSWTGVEDALPAAELYTLYGALSVVKKKLVKPILYGSHPIGRLYKRMTFGRQPWERTSYCSPAFTQSLNLRRKVKKSGFDPTFKHYFSHPKEMAALILDVNMLRLPFGAEFAHALGLEFRDPLGDPRVMECTLAIPNAMYFGDMNKWVIRSLMKGRLPDSVRLNQRKGKQSADICARLSAHHEEMEREFTEMEASGFGRIADLGRIREGWNALLSAPETFPINTTSNIMRQVAAYEFYRANEL